MGFIGFYKAECDENNLYFFLSPQEISFENILPVQLHTLSLRILNIHTDDQANTM